MDKSKTRRLTMSQDMLGMIVKKLVAMPMEIHGLIYDLLEKMSNPLWVEATKKFLRKENPWANFIAFTLPILVDETQTVEDAVMAGKFDWSGGDIVSKNFPMIKGGIELEREIVLFHFKKIMTTDEILSEIDRAGCKPARIWDLSGLAIKWPGLQREFPIVALGSICELVINLHAAFLSEFSGQRSIDLCRLEASWSSHFRFAGVRK
jgi:hypothetical protein